MGLYSVAIKLAGSVAFIVRAFQYAWPPLAYSVTDDAQAARLYGLVTTYYVLVSGWVVAGLALLGRWVLRLLTTHGYFGAYRALPWVALGWAMYGLWVVFLVIAGRAQVTRRNFPASLAGLLANVVLVVVLVPPLGIAGAGIALCGAYVVMLAVMYLLTRSAFRVRFEWRRLVELTLVMTAGAVAGDVLLPTHGSAGFLSRLVVFAMIPFVLFAIGFAHPQELAHVRRVLLRMRSRRPPGSGGVSRPAVSVVMPFAGDEGAAAAAAASLLTLRASAQDELILADNSGTVPALAAIQVGAGGRRAFSCLCAQRRSRRRRR